MFDAAPQPPAGTDLLASPDSEPLRVNDPSPGAGLPAWVRIWTKGRRIAASQRTAVITHWTSQILPPMLLLLVFSSYGPALWFLLTIPVVCAFFSIVFLPFKLIRLKQHRRYLLRPVLTITITAAMIGIANWSYSIAERQFESTARIIEALCKVQVECPTSLPGWQMTREGIYRSKVGTFITYPITYYYEGGRKFGLRLYQSLGMERYYTNVKDSPEGKGLPHQAIMNKATP